MHCDHQLISDHLYDYMDETASASLRKQIELTLTNCRTCQQTYRQALELTQASHNWTNQPVPEWHRTVYAVRPRQNSNAWLNWAALTSSSLAILMVIFQVQITTNKHGLNIAFGKQSNEQIEALFEQKLNQYKQEKNNLLDARFVAQVTQQINNNKLLVADILEKSREERRDDLNFLITGIQTQRFEDQQKVEKRLAYLADNQIENNQFINSLIESKKNSRGVK